MQKMRASDRKNISLLRKEVIIYMFIGIAGFLIILLGFILKPPQTYYKLKDVALGTYVNIVIGSNKINPERIAKAILDELKRLTVKFDPRNPRSIIHKINEANGDWVSVDEETFTLIKASIRFAQITDGAFDPTLGKLIELWGFDVMKPHLPTDDEIKETLKHSGYKNVLFDDKNMRVKLLNGIKLDLGGIAKGYALEKARQIAKSFDPDVTGFVEAGGDIRIIGPKFGREPWVVAIKDPRKEEPMDFIYLLDGAVATSGDYERFFEMNGRRYHHILDPKTGYPARGTWSATVIAEDAVTADALATAAFVLGKDWRFVVLEFPKLGGHVMLVLEGGTIKKSDTFKLFEREE